ncbi:unnamed protein product [Rotaria sordida]|uniref:Uncharacterized protein n=2 Tax=Rotaria sordida TaxID=392033 RepID=A0A815KGG0_9BILA|nr:unnamed protein product [Rotaria sordida]
MDDENSSHDDHETLSLDPLEKEKSNSTTLSEFDNLIFLPMTERSSTNPSLTTSNDPDVCPTANQGFTQRRTTMEPLPINEINLSKSSIICEKSKSIVNTHHYSTQTSMDKSNEQMSIQMNRNITMIQPPTNRPISNLSNVSCLNANAGQIKPVHVSKSTIVLNTAVNENRTNHIGSQNINSFNTNRSVINFSNTNSQTNAVQPSTSMVLKMRSADIRSSREFRDLEKTNRELTNKVNNLKLALKKVMKQKKKMAETHMLKPGAPFWNELSAFMNAHSNMYKGDGRTIQQVGAELGLNATLIKRVQQDAVKPDKIAMNVWRTICPTREDQLEVKSIKNIPPSTIRNIYTFARLCLPRCDLDFKKVRSDIAASLRLAHFHAKSSGNVPMIEDAPMNQNEDAAMNQNDDDDSDDCEELAHDLESLLENDIDIDSIMEDLDEDEEN